MNKGVIKSVDDNSIQKKLKHIPHYAIVALNKNTTKLQIVYCAFSKTKKSNVKFDVCTVVLLFWKTCVHPVDEIQITQSCISCWHRKSISSSWFARKTQMLQDLYGWKISQIKLQLKKSQYLHLQEYHLVWYLADSYLLLQ